VFVLLLAPTARSGTRSQLQQREHRQVVSLHRYVGTVSFFRHHPRLARTAVGRRELRRARIWVAVIRRELAETRAQREARDGAARSRAVARGAGGCGDRIRDGCGPLRGRPMSEALQLFPLPPHLTDRQQRALDAITAAGHDGLTSDELGQALHQHGGDTSASGADRPATKSATRCAPRIS
jgi:hypothetical protein